MLNIIVPTHRVQQVVNTLYDRWSETRTMITQRPIMVFGRYVKECEGGLSGCYAIFCINGIVYIDSELYGKTNSKDDILLVAQIMELQTKWGKDNEDGFREELVQKIKELSS